MSAHNDGGPAFPHEFKDYDYQDCAWKTQWVHEGMTMRDYFAAKAMQGDIASMDASQDPSEAATTIAIRAYQIADAMLAARDV